MQSAAIRFLTKGHILQCDSVVYPIQRADAFLTDIILLDASCSGNSRTGLITLAVKSINTIRIPGMMHQPAEARNAPTKNVPSCAVIPAAPARPLTTVTSFRLSFFALPASVVRILHQSCNYILSVIVPELVPDACVHGHLIQIRHLHNQG